MEIAIQPVRPYTQGKLKDPSKQFLYAAPFTADRFTLESKGAARDSLTARIAQAAAALDDSMADGIVIDMFHGPFSTILAILPNGATRSTRTWDHEVHFTRQVLAAVNMHDPATGEWQRLNVEGEIVEVGSTWECGYCSYQTLCSGTEAGRIPVESVVSIGAVA